MIGGMMQGSYCQCIALSMRYSLNSNPRIALPWYCQLPGIARCTAQCLSFPCNHLIFSRSPGRRNPQIPAPQFLLLPRYTPTPKTLDTLPTTPQTKFTTRPPPNKKTTTKRIDTMQPPDQEKLSRAIMVLDRAITAEGIDNPALSEVLRAAKEWHRINASLAEGDGYVG